jgi:RNA polymerase sigma factor (sigma-70 family)
MPAISSERAQWLARHILPLEPQLRAWLVRAVPAGLQADDVIQEAYAKLAVVPSVDNIQYPKAYLFQVARRLISEHLRSAHVIPIEAVAELAQLQVEQEVRSPERIVSAHQELEQLLHAIDELPGSCRAVFILRKIDEMPQRQIALQLNISERCVEKRMSRALKGIMKAIPSTRTAADVDRRAKVLPAMGHRVLKRGIRAP